MLLRPDGSASFAKPETEDSTDQHCFDINKDGLMFIGGSSASKMQGHGALFAGDKLLLSNFSDGSPNHESLLVSKTTVESFDFENGFWDNSINHSVVDSQQLLDSYLQNDIEVHRIIRGYYAGLFEPTLSWREILENRWWVPRITDIMIPVNHRGDLMSNIGPNKVFLVRLPDDPPRGLLEIAPGVNVKNSDIWYRRFEKIITCSHLPVSSVLRLIGTYEDPEGSSYLVCLCPEEIEFFTLTISDTSTDAVIDAFHSIVSLLEALHANGITGSGCINPDMFLMTTSGKIFINTGYIIAKFADVFSVFGGYSASELRFLSPNRFSRLSSPVACVFAWLGLSIPRPINPVADDLYSLGILLNYMRHPGCLPFVWLTHAQFALVSWFAATGDPCASRLLSILHEDACDDLEHVKLRDIEHASPIEKLALRCMDGSMSIDELRSSIERYIAWRDDEMNNTSVETEMRAVFSKFSTLVQSSQHAVRSVLEKYE